jgi:hypothetical protein
LPLFLQWKSNRYYTFWLCVFSLRYSTRNAHVPYCHLWPPRLYKIFPHYLINGTTFEKTKLLNIKCVFLFSLHIWLKHFLFDEELSEIQGDQKYSVHLMITIQKITCNVQTFPRQSPDIYWHAELCSRCVLMWSEKYIGLHVKCPLFLSDSNETWIFRTDCLKILKYQISLKSIQWKPNCSMLTYRRTDWQTDMKKLIVAFRNYAKAPTS